MEEHVNNVLTGCASNLYALNMLRAHGLQGVELAEIYRAKILSKIMYGSPAWWGYCSADTCNRIDSFLKKGKKFGFYGNDAIGITLLDLRNASGEINHNLIYSTLRYHMVPEELISIIKDIYTSSMITVAHGSSITQFVSVERGVLQDDPCSPLLFNICFNPLMQAIIQSKLKHLGYMWGPNANLLPRSWLQFADDTVIISVLKVLNPYLILTRLGAVGQK